MKINWIGSVIAAALAITACGKITIGLEDTMVTKVIVAENAPTKTLLQGRDVLWEETDRVCCVTLYNYQDEEGQMNRSYIYTGIKPSNIDGNTADFTITCGGAYTPAYLVYPSSKNVGYDFTTESLTLPVPETYELVSDNIPASSNISVGVVENDRVSMKNVMTLVKFEVSKGDTLKNVVFSTNGSEAIAGELSYNALSNEVIATSGVSEITLGPSAGEEDLVPGVYYFPLPSITLSTGFKIRVDDTQGRMAEKSYAEELGLERNHILDLGPTSEWNLEYISNTRTLYAQVHDGTALIGTGWPFVEDRPSTGNVCGKGIVGPYHLLDNADAPFYFYVASKVDGSSWTIKSGDGLSFGGNVHDYMLLPALDRYRLASVTIKSAKSRTYAITDNPSSGIPSVVSGGTAKKISSKATYTFTLTETEAGTAYRLDLPTTEKASLYEFSLTYERAE